MEGSYLPFFGEGPSSIVYRIWGPLLGIFGLPGCAIQRHDQKCSAVWSLMYRVTLEVLRGLLSHTCGGDMCCWDLIWVLLLALHVILTSKLSPKSLLPHSYFYLQEAWMLILGYVLSVLSWHCMKTCMKPGIELRLAVYKASILSF